MLRRISQLSNHSTPRSYRSIIQSQLNTSYFEIKAGLKALEFGVMFSFATDNCVLSVVFSSPPPPRPPPCFCLSPCCWFLWLPPQGFMKCICVTLLCCMLLYCYMLCRCSSDTSTVGWEELHFNLKTPNPMDCYIYQ